MNKQIFVLLKQEKLKTFCKNEINEKIKLDLIVYKYQLDSCKIENELRLFEKQF